MGDLDSNEEVVVGDIHLSEWFPDRFFASGRWAVVGLSVREVPAGRWNGLQVRLTGLETVLGNAIAATSWPRSGDVEPQRFSADLNSDACFESLAEGVTLTAKYDTTFTAGDRYRFGLTNFATIKLVAEAPLTVDEWECGWIDPLVGLLTLATGEREEVNQITLTAPDPRSPEEPHGRGEIRGELWGGGIHQRDQPAELRTRSDGSVLVPLFTLDNAPPLALLLRTWQTTLADETATSLYRLAIDPTLPTQVRYLLCAQALEALDSTIHAAEEEAEDIGYAERRAAVLSAITGLTDDHLDSESKRFIRHNLVRRPHRSLANRLHGLLRRVPEHDTRSQKWEKQTEPLAAELDALGRHTHPLHERLASARNALSHGSVLSPPALRPAVRILESLLRGQLLTRLGFEEEQTATAYERMTREP